jgi:hypothetical protein
VTPSAADLRALHDAIAGDVILPDSSAYEAVRRPPMARFHTVRPQAVVQCATPLDVIEAIAFARRFNLETATRSGGHCFAGRSSTRGLVIDVSRMHAVSVAGDRVKRKDGSSARLTEWADVLNCRAADVPTRLWTEGVRRERTSFDTMSP